MTETETEKPQEPGWRDKTLERAGIGYMGADMLGIGSSVARGEFQRSWGAAAGFAIWFAGGLAAARYGNPSPDKQLELQAAKLESMMKQHGLDIPDDARARNQLLRKKSFFEKCEGFIYEHPSEILNTMFAIGAAGLIHTGWKDRPIKPLIPKSFNLDGIRHMGGTFWMGVLVFTGALSGLFIKEDPNAREKAKDKNIFARIFAFAQEKPLRLTGGLYAANNLFGGVNFLGDLADAETLYAEKTIKPHYLSGPMFATYVLSNVMMMLSSRNQIKNVLPQKDITQLEDAAARIVATQSPEKQKEMVAEVANFLAVQKNIHLPASEIAEQLVGQLALLTKERLQPAVAEVTWAERESARQKLAEAAVASTHQFS